MEMYTHKGEIRGLKLCNEFTLGLSCFLTPLSAVRLILRNLEVLSLSTCLQFFLCYLFSSQTSFVQARLLSRVAFLLAT